MGRFSYLAELSDNAPSRTTDGASDERPIDKMPGWMKTWYEASQVPAGAVETGLVEAMNIVTGGAVGTGIRHLGAAGKANAEGTSYGEALHTMGENMQGAREDHPVASIIGQIGGALPLAALGMGAAAKYAPELLATKSGAIPALKRTGAAMLGGGAAGLGADIGMTGTENTDELSSFSLGAIGGGIGQALAEVGGPLIKYVAKRMGLSGKEQQAVRMAESFANPSDTPGDLASMAARMNKPEGVSESTLLTMADEVPPGGLFGEHPDLLNQTKRLAGTPSTVGQVGPMRQVMEDRIANIPDDAVSVFQRALPASPTRAASLDALEAARKEAQDNYTQVLEAATQKGVSLPKKTLISKVKEPFQNIGNLSSDEQKLMMKALDEIDVLANKGTHLDAKAGQKLKDSLSSYIDGLTPSTGEPTTVMKKLRRIATEVNAEIDDYLGRKIAGYEAANAKYASNVYAIKNARDAGFDGFRLSKVTPEMLGKQHQALAGDPAAQASFEYGAIQAFTEQLERAGEGGMSMIRKAAKGPTKELDKLSAVVGPDAAVAIQRDADLMVTQLNNAKSLLSASDSAAAARQDPKGMMEQTLVDLGAVFRGTFGGAGRTQAMAGARHLGTKPDVQLEQSLMDLSQMTPDEAKARIAEVFELMRKSKMQGSFTPGAVGSATLGSILD